MQAALTMVMIVSPACTENADHLTNCYVITHVQRADHRLKRGADGAVVNADHWLASDRSGEDHRATRGRQDGLTRLGGKINAAVTGSPGRSRGIEPALYHRRPTERPAGRTRQPRNRHGWCYRADKQTMESAQEEGQQERRPKASSGDVHVGSFWTPARIVRPAGIFVDDS
jgi:hypothetical protein